jgi:L-amino acid N-acyltransferase YncA
MSCPSQSLHVRLASPADGEACAAIYEPYVLTSAITFELAPPSAAEMSARIAKALEHHAWVVCESDTGVLGYAYGGQFARRPAYRWSCEVSVYVAGHARGRGVGRALYEALLALLAARGYRMAAAGMTLPNEASEALHRVVGFEPVGTYRRIGFKSGAWHDVAWFQRALDGGEDPPAEPS